MTTDLEILAECALTINGLNYINIMVELEHLNKYHRLENFVKLTSFIHDKKINIHNTYIKLVHLYRGYINYVIVDNLIPLNLTSFGIKYKKQKKYYIYFKDPRVLCYFQ